MVSEDGVTSRYFDTEAPPAASCIFEHVYFARPDSQNLRPLGAAVPRRDGPPARARIRRRRRPRRPRARLRRHRRPRLRRRIRHPLQPRPHPQPLRRPHLHPARAARPRLRRPHEAQPRPHLLEGKRVILIDDSIIRGTTSERSSAWCAPPAPTKSTCASPVRPPSRPASTASTRPSKKDLIAANNSVEEIRQYIEADSLAYLSLVGLTHSCTTGEPVDGLSPASFCTACYTGNYPTQWVDVSEILPAVAIS